MRASQANFVTQLVDQDLPLDPLRGRELDREFLNAAIRSRFAIETDVELSEIEGELEFIELRSGEMLFEENDASSDVYIVLSGRLRAVRRRRDAKFELLGEIGRGETVGELAFLSDTRRSASVVAVRRRGWPVFRAMHSSGCSAVSHDLPPRQCGLSSIVSNNNSSTKSAWRRQ